MLLEGGVSGEPVLPARSAPGVYALVMPHVDRAAHGDQTCPIAHKLLAERGTTYQDNMKITVARSSSCTSVGVDGDGDAFERDHNADQGYMSDREYVLEEVS